MNHIAAICNRDLGLAVACCDNTIKGCWNKRIYGPCIAEDGLDESRDSGRVAEIETCGDGEDFVRSGGSKGDVKVGTTWICHSEGCGEEDGENEAACGKRLPD